MMIHKATHIVDLHCELVKEEEQIYTHAHIHGCILTCMDMGTPIHTYTHMLTHAHAHAHAHARTHTHTHTH